MRATRRLIPGIVVFLVAAGVASAQRPKPEPSLPPLPKARVTPTPQPPDTVPPTEQKFRTLVLVPIRTAPAKKASTSPAKKPAQARANKKPIEEPATADGSSKAKEPAAVASGVTAESSFPPPPGAGTANVPAGTASPVLSPKAPQAVNPVVQAAVDKKLADAAQRKKSVGSWILLGFGGLALIGLAVHFVRSRSRADTLPPIFVPPGRSGDRR